jgi:hypothetical protein
VPAATLALFLDQRQPLYFQYHLAKIKFATSYSVCLKQQNWVCVSMTMRQTIDYPRSCSFRSCRPRITGAEEHNLRAFPLAGIVDAAEASGALLKYGEFTTPFDLRDGVRVVRNRTEIRVAVVARLPRVHERQHQTQRSPLARAHLVKLSPGGTAAENEHRHLDDYFLENASSAARCAARLVW